MPRALLPLLILLTTPAVFSGEGNASPFGDYDEVIRDLVPNLGRDRVSAQDAALKLARLGKRTVPILQEILHSNIHAREPKGEAAKDPKQNAAYLQARQLAYYSTLSLSRIKHADAGNILLPILKNPRSLPELRALALDALGLELVEEAGAVLQEIAASDEDPQFRKKALLQLSIMPGFWANSEKLFVDALSSGDDETRLLAAKQCYFARIYNTASDKLIELAVRDSNPDVRLQAMLAIGRMRPQRAVPPLVRALDETLSDRDRTQVVRTINAVTGIQFKDSAGVQAWWKRQGEKEYARLAEGEAQVKAATSADPPPVAPKIDATPVKILKPLPAEPRAPGLQGLEIAPTPPAAPSVPPAKEPPSAQP